MSVCVCVCVRVCRVFVCVSFRQAFNALKAACGIDIEELLKLTGRKHRSEGEIEGVAVQDRERESK